MTESLCVAKKCGKPIGFVTVLASGLTGLQQPVPNVKIVAICMDCYQKKSYPKASECGKLFNAVNTP